jgi:uroporphyrinogen decarboxylase
MTNRENFFAAIKGEKHERTPYYLFMCDQLRDKLKNEKNVDSYEEYFDIPFRSARIKPSKHPVDYSKYYKGKDVDYIGEWGDGHKYGSIEHFTHFIPCMNEMETLEEIWEFPLPDVLADYRWEGAKEEVARLKEQDFIVIGNVTIDIFEPAWYLRGMEEMLIDFYVNPEMAIACLDRIKNVKIKLAERLAEIGVDIIIYGDDVGTQTGMMMSPDLHPFGWTY